MGTVVLALALFLGWMTGDGHDHHLQDVAGPGTGQRGTAALVVAQTNVEDPRVLVVITLGIVLLIAAAKVMDDGNDFSVLIPTTAADPPQRPSERQSP